MSNLIDAAFERSFDTNIKDLEVKVTYEIYDGVVGKRNIKPWDIWLNNVVEAGSNAEILPMLNESCIEDLVEEAEEDYENFLDESI